MMSTAGRGVRAAVERAGAAGSEVVDREHRDHSAVDPADVRAERGTGAPGVADAASAVCRARVPRHGGRRPSVRVTDAGHEADRRQRGARRLGPGRRYAQLRSLNNKHTSINAVVRALTDMVA